jgi:hypothetical protein
MGLLVAVVEQAGRVLLVLLQWAVEAVLEQIALFLGPQFHMLAVAELTVIMVQVLRQMEVQQGPAQQ